ncbi:hypothetical protein KUCAC02_006208, partial [Chaenocephalus aceratus]
MRDMRGIFSQSFEPIRNAVMAAWTRTPPLQLLQRDRAQPTELSEDLWSLAAELHICLPPCSLCEAYAGRFLRCAAAAFIEMKSTDFSGCERELESTCG